MPTTPTASSSILRTSSLEHSVGHGLFVGCDYWKRILTKGRLKYNKVIIKVSCQGDHGFLIFVGQEPAPKKKEKEDTVRDIPSSCSSKCE